MPDLSEWNTSPSPLMKTMGFVRAISVDAEEGRAVVEFEAKINQCHSGNVVQGGYVAGWIDNAMATAVLFKTDFQKLVMSLEIKVSYYRAANPGIVIAEGWIERIGKKTAFAEGLLRTPDGVIIAKASSTIALLPQKKQD